MELFAADGHDAGGCERVTGKSGMRPEQLFALLDEHILPEADRTVWRPGRVILGHAPPGPTPPRPAQGTADAQDPAHRDIHRGGHNY